MTPSPLPNRASANERLEARRRLMDDRRLLRVALRAYGVCILMFVAVATIGITLVMLIAEPTP